jgi:P pilus assembly chaperone PapD
MRFFSRFFSHLSVAFLLLLAISDAQAHLTISPPQIIRSSNGTGLVEVRSTAPSTSYWQVRVMEWSQNGEKNVLQASEGIPISPRFFHLEPGESQVIRALFPKESRHYFRILIEQIPSDTEGQGVSLNFRFSLPVYLYANEPVPRAAKFPPDAKCLSIENTSDRVQQITLDFQPQDIPVILPQATMSVCKKDGAKL